MVQPAVALVLLASMLRWEAAHALTVQLDGMTTIVARRLHVWLAMRARVHRPVPQHVAAATLGHILTLASHHVLRVLQARAITTRTLRLLARLVRQASFLHLA